MTRPRFQGSEEWLAWRRGGYGASDAPTLVLGDEKAWQELHAVKLGLIPDPEATEAMEWGKRLEDVIAHRYAEQEGEPVIRVDQPLEHPDLPFVRASLDRRRKRGRVVVELKAWSFKSTDFGPDGSDQVPDRMYYQVQQQLAVTAYDQADLAVFFGASKHLSVFHLGRDQATIDDLLALESENWAHIAAGRMPPWPGPIAERALLRADEISADTDLVALVEAHAAAAAASDMAANLLEQVRGQLRERLRDVGGARGLLATGQRFSVAYRPNRDSVTSNWEQIAAGYRRRLLELGVPESELQFTESALTVVKPGARPLVVRLAKEEARAAA
jgi:putative phage-type endonuclease